VLEEEYLLEEKKELINHLEFLSGLSEEVEN
jgi:hypothetical protein